MNLQKSFVTCNQDLFCIRCHDCDSQCGSKTLPKTDCSDYEPELVKISGKIFINKVCRNLRVIEEEKLY